MNFSSDNPARVLIVDDHAIVRYGMGVLLGGADDLALCGEADTCDEALTAIRELNPDVAVIDIILHDQSGLDLIREIRAEENRKAEDGRQTTDDGEQSSDANSNIPTPPHSTTPTPPRPLPILVLSMHNESTHAEKALRAGAQGYIMKEDADEVLVAALRTVLNGKIFVSDNINEKMLRTMIDGEEKEQSGIDSLTAREKEIFECLGNGLTTREMAEQLGLSPRTVEVHRARIKKKLECETAAQLLRAAVQALETNR